MALRASLAAIYDTDDANDARRAFPRPVGGLSRPVSSVPQSRPQRMQSGGGITAREAVQAGIVSATEP